MNIEETSSNYINIEETSSNCMFDNFTLLTILLVDNFKIDGTEGTDSTSTDTYDIGTILSYFH